MSKKFKVLGGIVLAIALVVVGLTTVVLADSPDNSAGVTACQTGTWGPMGFRGACDGSLLETVSDVVGLSPEEICELRQEGMSLVEIAEQQGVDEQTLTDAVLAAMSDRVSEALNRAEFGRPGFTPLVETVSDVVGLSTEEICELRQEGMSLVEIAEQQGVDEQTLTDAVLAAAGEALQQKVDEGILTQEQADLILERITDRVSDDLNRTDFGPAGNGPRFGQHQGPANRFGGSRLGIGPGGMHRWGEGLS